jgi:hypothetical protein
MYNVCRGIFQKLIVANLVKKLPAFFGNQRFIFVLKNPLLCPILSPLIPVHPDTSAGLDFWRGKKKTAF